jgi:hypothetical protein
MEVVFILAVVLVVFDILALRFGHDSRDLRRPAAWW